MAALASVGLVAWAIATAGATGPGGREYALAFGASAVAFITLVLTIGWDTWLSVVVRIVGVAAMGASVLILSSPTGGGLL